MVASEAGSRRYARTAATEDCASTTLSAPAIRKAAPRTSRAPVEIQGAMPAKPRSGDSGSAQRDRSTSKAKSCLSAAIGVPGVHSTTPESRLKPITCAEWPTS